MSDLSFAKVAAILDNETVVINRGSFDSVKADNLYAWEDEDGKRTWAVFKVTEIEERYSLLRILWVSKDGPYMAKGQKLSLLIEGVE